METMQENFYCPDCGEEVGNESMKCPCCGTVCRDRLDKMLSKNPLVPFLDFIDSLFTGIGVLLFSWEVWPGRQNMAFWAPLAALLAGMALYYLFCYTVFGQTLMETMFGVVVVNRKCRQIGPLRGLARAFVFIMTFLVIRIIFAILPFSLNRGLHDRLCGTYQVKRKALYSYLVPGERR